MRMASLCQRARHMWQDLAMGKPQGGKEAHQARSQEPEEINCEFASAATVARLGISRKAAGSVRVRSEALAAHKATGRMAMAGVPNWLKTMWSVQPYRQLREKLGSLNAELKDISP